MGSRGGLFSERAYMGGTRGSGVWLVHVTC